jgi:ankyrin repeat protein
MHWFALHGHREAIAGLLRMGAAVDPPAVNMQTPLMWCVVRGNVELMLLLLDNGADIGTLTALLLTP